MVTVAIENIYGKTWTKDFQNEQDAERYIENIAWSEELKSSAIIK